MFYNNCLNKIICLFLLIFGCFLNLDAKAEDFYNNKTQNNNYNCTFSCLTNYKLASLNTKNTPDNNFSDDFSEFGLSDELNNNNFSYPLTIRDPFESINRKFFVFSLWVDKYSLQYITIVYLKLVAPPIRSGILSAVNNFNEPISAVNHLLQFKIVSFTKCVARFFVNTTLGFFGFVDVASKLNLPPNNNDFGYTLTYYKVGDGFYLFLPLLGPYTLNTATADLITNYVYSRTFDKLIHIRSDVSIAFNIAQRGIPYIENNFAFIDILKSSVDPYTFVKSAYIQNRKIYFQKLKQSW